MFRDLDVLLKHANDLCELLFAGDRKCEISTAETAHMMPEAMLIASFTDKKLYPVRVLTLLQFMLINTDPPTSIY
ncbi:hypothetical protein PsorP6_016101 [Peronosclerospora sorghi]|uniref:Uncharacterized protein n=1 Tax=Peronosclerospora sorghi TaxID=230839 RepID=A0ACC0VQZ7_9STRA|nr:hypothetical protein PsorP6_016101 [Peronosclerospora sorghi]